MQWKRSLKMVKISPWSTCSLRPSSMNALETLRSRPVIEQTAICASQRMIAMKLTKMAPRFSMAKCCLEASTRFSIDFT